MTVVGSYIDRALSAKTADRPEFQRMIKDSAKGLFEIVLVWKLDRFSLKCFMNTPRVPPIMVPVLKDWVITHGFGTTLVVLC